MFVQSLTCLAIGEVIKGVADHHRVPHHHVIGIVMRAATKEEWWAQVAAKEVQPDPWPDAKFYWISID